MGLLEGLFHRLRKPPALEARFTEVYEKALWGDDETRSGWGSKRESGHVQAALAYLNEIIPARGVRSVADIPCGDFNWQPLLLERWPGLDYAGYDIVRSLIADVRRKHPAVRFAVLDVTKQVPPRADLILCKDLLNHLTYDDIRRALANMKRSGAMWLLASNDFTHASNEDVIDAGNNHRPVDICKPPLHAPPPEWSTHYMGLWRLEAMPFD